MSLQTRKADIRAVAQLAQVKSKDAQGRVRSLTVPGHECYRLVLLSRVKSKPYIHLAAECHLKTGIGLVPCDGNGPHRYGSTVCYHAIGATEKGLAASKVKILGWFDSEEKMIKSKNLTQFKGGEPGHLYAKKWGRVFTGVWFLWRWA